MGGGGADFAVVSQVEQQVTTVVNDQVQRFRGGGSGATGFLIVGQSCGRGGGISRRNHEPAQGGGAAVVGVDKFNGVANLSQGARVHVRYGAHLTQSTVADAQSAVA